MFWFKDKIWRIEGFVAVIFNLGMILKSKPSLTPCEREILWGPRIHHYNRWELNNSSLRHVCYRFAHVLPLLWWYLTNMPTPIKQEDANNRHVGQKHPKIKYSYHKNYKTWANIGHYWGCFCEIEVEPLCRKIARRWAAKKSAQWVPVPGSRCSLAISLSKTPSNILQTYLLK